MLTFSYTARDPATGQKLKAEVQAENEQAAARLVQQQGLSMLEMNLKEGVGGNAGLGKLFKRIKAKDKILFSRQLSTLINAGLPLVQSLRSIAKQTKNKHMKVVVNQVITDVESGQAFAAALASHPTVFDNVFVNLVAAGEASGTLDKSLERLANQQEKDAEIISKVRGAMVYPAIVLLVMVLVVGFMVLKVLPQVEELYTSIGGGASLPILTRVLLGVSAFVRNYWYFAIAIVVGMIFFGSRWARSFGGKRVIDRLKMTMWPIGNLFMKMYMARFARTGTTLVASGVPLVQTLQITGRSINNIHIEEALKQATEKVKAGKSLSESLEGNPNFLDLVPNMLKIGEQSGAMEQMLEKTADYYEKEVDNEIKTISTIIEPIMMILLGIVAITIVAAVLMPIYGLVNEVTVV
ncbi:type II secretion system F family protein [Candidatus Saccharibacteria bacterium]|nr:type II secretion system F family protein [Candidatus Saccharibacteria bacterium]